MNVLYVENHARFAEVVTKTFLYGYCVIRTPSLSAARTALSSDTTFDAILIDYDLDDGKGTELVSELQFKTLRPPIIAASSHEEGNNALLRAGADAVCCKGNFANIAEVLQGALRC